jgi:hypothetical protein
MTRAPTRGHQLIPHSRLRIHHGGHLELAADSERLAAAVEAFLNADLTAGEPAMTQVTSAHLGESLGTDFWRAEPDGPGGRRWCGR